jgi:glycosyltransferase involved in cell wall biosynthesis
VNAVPSAEEVARLDAAAQMANAGVTIDIPTAVGFCMFIRRDCLDAVGAFREDVFAQGYGEENDFCIRAQQLGWRHVALAGLYVGHIGSQSFTSAKQHLRERNLCLINRLHPGYDALVGAFQTADPLAPARRRMDAVRWRRGRNKRGAVILVGHAAAGGVRRRLLERCAETRDDGLRPVLLLPGPTAGGVRHAAISDADPDAYPNLTFALPNEREALTSLLRAERPTHVELHHWLGHDVSVFDLVRRLEVPYDVVVHDYSWFCPRITLTGPDGRYCGEPSVAWCEAGAKDAGDCAVGENTPAALRQQSRAVLAQARTVTAPSRDTARRIERQFDGLTCGVDAPENDALIAASPRQPRRRSDVLRVCVVGAISLQKGYDYLLACARDVAARALPVRFSVVGFTCDDEPLLETKVLSITGPYKEDEVQELIRMQAADVGFLPACWPETWSYTLSAMWQAGLDVFVFDLGAPAERVARSGRGRVLPLGLPPQRFNEILLRIWRS